MNKTKNYILADARWSGQHGIGRFSAEILSRLTHTDFLKQGPKPLSLSNIPWQYWNLDQYTKNYRVFFNPGFHAISKISIPYILTICDLIYLQTQGLKGIAKKFYFEKFVKKSILNAASIITISEYSKKAILDWTGIRPEKVTNVSCGISEIFHAEGEKYLAGYPYLLHVGNTKAHKNVPRMLEAYAKANIPEQYKLILTGEKTNALMKVIEKNHLHHRIIFCGSLTEHALARYYRGAEALLFPSLHEGFGLPILEAMACGTPVLTSNLTSCPEVAGDAAMIINAYDVTSIQQGIEKIVLDPPFRHQLMKKGLHHSTQFTWDNTARAVQLALCQF